MPTGYTHDIPKGIDFKTFALNCARAFGACVTLRDEPGGGEMIPDQFEPSDYYAKEAQKAHDELALLQAMPEPERNRRARKAWDDAETRRLMRLEEIAAIRKAYEAMLAKVNAWTPPTPDHAGLRDFMREQIEKSLDFDCNTSFYTNPTPVLTVEQWAQDEAARLTLAIAYHEKEHADEVQRAASRTAWVRSLRASLE